MADEKKSPINVKESKAEWKPPSFVDAALSNDGSSFLDEKKRQTGKGIAMQQKQSKKEAADSIDYVELLRATLQQKKLMYIADIILEVEQFTLEQLMKWTRNHLIQLLDDINNDDNNNHKIKVSHINKFADAVCDIATKYAVSSGSIQLKLIFLGKDEEEAIESIQSGQIFMEKNLDKMKELFNNLDENNKNIKQHLEKICNQLKQQIDEKQKEMLSSIDNFYQYYLNALNKRNEVVQESAKAAAKFYNDYENYFTDNKLTKPDRKNKLVAAKESIDAEVNKLKKYQDIEYKMDVVLDKESIAQCLDQCFGFNNVGALPVIDGPEMDGTMMKWKSPDIKGDVINLLKNTDDDNKEENELIINYEILYRAMDETENDEKKEDVIWNRINNLGNVNQYDMNECVPFEAKVKYNVNNMLVSPESASVFVKRPTWSSGHGWKWVEEAQSSYQSKKYYEITNNSKTIHKVENAAYIYNMRMDPWISKQNSPNQVFTVSLKVDAASSNPDQCNAIGVISKSRWDSSDHLWDSAKAFSWRIKGDGIFKNKEYQKPLPALSVNQIIVININSNNNDIEFKLFENEKSAESIATANGIFEIMEKEEICICIATRKTGWKFTIIDK